MNSRTSSISVAPPRAQLNRRLSLAVSNAEQGEAGLAPTGVEARIDEEIDEIKRYEARRLL
jgi:hypothetical protein